MLFQTHLDNLWIDDKGRYFVIKNYVDGKQRTKASKRKKVKINKIKNLTTKEKWKEIDGANGLTGAAGYHSYVYMVSNGGRVKRRRYIYRTPVYTEKLMKAQVNNRGGYLMVAIRNNRKTLYPTLARLVAEYFLEDWDPKLEVDYKDDNIKNCRASNLQMMGHTENLLKYWNGKEGLKKRAATELKYLENRLPYWENKFNKYKVIKEMRESGKTYAELRDITRMKNGQIWHVINIAYYKSEKMLKKLYKERTKLKRKII